ncbi:unnamed protein product [Sphacelaria rigidula]
MSNIRAIAGSHRGDKSAVGDEPSTQSYGKHRAIALFYDSGAPGAVVDGVPMQTEGALDGGDGRRSSQSERVESRTPRERTAHTVFSTCAAEVNSRELSASTAPTTICHEVGTPTREGRETTGGIPCEVATSTPPSKTNKRRAPPGSGRGTPSHAHISASRRKRNKINHPDVSSAWGTWAEQQEAALQHRDRGKEHAVKALPSPQVATTPVSPCNTSLEPPLGSPDTSQTLQRDLDRRFGFRMQRVREREDSASEAGDDNGKDFTF